MTAMLRPNSTQRSTSLPSSPQRATAHRHVFDDTTDERGSRFCGLSLERDGRLAIEIHDCGPVVQEHFGAPSYDSFERFSIEQTQQLCDMFGDDVVAGVGRQFGGSAEAFHEFVELTGVGHGVLWTRIGD